MRAVEIICKKRDGGELSEGEIRWMVSSFVAGHVAPEQMSAFCMSILFSGMSERETSFLTRAYVESGSVMQWNVSRPTCDKHSTGGVGDKVTLVLTPVAVACGLSVPQLSGRGLGHTGGTLDKLESIPGWTCDLDIQRMRDIMGSVGAIIAAASDDLAPADKMIYALRDVTGTVESMPLIAASIMSKKIAEGTSALVLDVKAGSGAFMKTTGAALALASSMVDIGWKSGVKTSAFVTDMSVPLGRSAGNSVETSEAIECLNGGGPEDLREITLVLANEMLRLSGVVGDPERVLENGEAMKAFEDMVKSQGGDLSKDMPLGDLCYEVKAEVDGYITQIDAMSVGLASWRLGAGRSVQGEKVDYGAGITWGKTVGDWVRKGETVFKLYAGDRSKSASAVAALDGAVTISKERSARRDVVLKHVTHNE